MILGIYMKCRCYSYGNTTRRIDMKKPVVLIITLLIAIAILLSFSACGSTNEKAEKYCWSCGKGISKEAAFCEYCGAAVMHNQNETENSTAETDDATTTTDSADNTTPSTEETQSQEKPVETQTPTELPTTVPPTTEPPATIPPVTESPTTAPPVTAPPTTAPPATEVTDYAELTKKHSGRWYLQGYSDIYIDIALLDDYDAMYIDATGISLCGDTATSDSYILYPSLIDEYTGYHGMDISFEGWDESLEKKQISLNDTYITLGNRTFVRSPGTRDKYTDTFCKEALGTWYLDKNPDVQIVISIIGGNEDSGDYYGIDTKSLDLTTLQYSKNDYCTITAAKTSDWTNLGISVSNDILTISNAYGIKTFYREPRYSTEPPVTEPEPSVHTHTWVEATCTTAKTCSVCKDTEGTAIGHVWDKVIVQNEATCTQEGKKTSVCSACNKQKTETIEKMPHNYIKGRCTVCNTIIPVYNADKKLLDEFQGVELYYKGMIYWGDFYIMVEVTNNTDETIIVQVRDDVVNGHSGILTASQKIAPGKTVEFNFGIDSDDLANFKEDFVNSVGFNLYLIYDLRDTDMYHKSPNRVVLYPYEQ